VLSNFDILFCEFLKLEELLLLKLLFYTIELIIYFN